MYLMLKLRENFGLGIHIRIFIGYGKDRLSADELS